MVRLVLLALCVSACGLHVRSQAEAELRKRAAFEMRCPEAQLQLTPLGEPEPGADVPKQEGVSGCGQQAVYVYSWQVHAFVNNTTARPEK